VKRNGEVRQPFKPKPTIDPSAPFDGTSTTRDDYINHGRVVPPQAVRPTQTVVKSGPFDATSTHARDFHQHPNAARRSFKPTDNSQRPGENRDFQTEAGQFGRTRGAPAQLCKPANGPSTIPESRDFRTEANASFDDKGFVAERAKRPDNQYVPSGAFDGTTTTGADFQVWPRQASKSYKPAQSAMHSDVPFDPTTNYSSEFVKRNGEVRQPFKPKSTIDPSAPFDGSSTTRDDYKNHGRVVPPQAVRPAQTVVKSAPFDASSTHARDFHEHPSAARRSFKPLDASSRLGEDRDFHTDHRDNYVLYGGKTYVDRTMPEARKTGSFRYLR
jgi:hypothetical protein